MILQANLVLTSAITFFLTPLLRETTLPSVPPRTLMQTVCPHRYAHKPAFLLSVILYALLFPLAVHPQDGAGDPSFGRGNRAEISVTIRDSSGEPVPVPAFVKLLHEGQQVDQANTSRGRAFFILRSLGDYTVVVEAVGYKSAQKDVLVQVPVKLEMDINLQSDSDPNYISGAPTSPILAPKARDDLQKGLQALRENNLSQAEKYLKEAIKLAPGHPEVLYAQGVLDLKQSNWVKAQAVLEKATQIDSNNARAFSALGMALCNQKKYPEAIAPLEKSLQMEIKGGWETHWALAESYYHQERYDDALKQSQQSATLASGQAPQVELLLAKSLTAVGRFEDAAQALRDFLKNHPDDKDAPTARRWLDGLKANGKIH